MKDNNIEIIDDEEISVDENISTNVDVQQNSIANIDKTQIIDTKVDNSNNTKNSITSNVDANAPVTLVETAVTKGSAGSQVVGNINGDSIIPTNNPLPTPIDITVKQKNNNKNNNKKVKIVSKKEKIMSIIISIFVLIVLGGAGYAIYYFGYKNNPNLFELKNIYLELGEELPNSASSYIKSSKQIDEMEYKIDTSSVVKNTVGSYTYSVNHKGVTKTAQIIIRDTKAPVLTLKDQKELIFQKDSKIAKTDLVVSCEDISNCTYKTEYDVSTEDAGEKQVVIVARDDIGNETKEVVTITIIDVQKKLECTSQESEADDKSYKYVLIDTLSFDSNDNLVLKSGVKKYIYSDYSAYFTKLNELKDNENYEFDRTNFSYTEKNEVDVNNLTSLSDITNYYSEKGYICN